MVKYGDDLNETITEIKVEVAKQGVKIEAIDEKLDTLHSDVKDIRTAITGEVKDTNKWYRSAIFKLLMIAVGLGSGLGAVEIVKAAIGG